MNNIQQTATITSLTLLLGCTAAVANGGNAPETLTGTHSFQISGMRYINGAL